MKHFAYWAALAIAMPAYAQEQGPRAIHVTGSGSVKTMPDRAVIQLEIIGEGKTSDEATRSLAARQKTITEGLGALLAGDGILTTGQLKIQAVHGPQCKGRSDYDDIAKLSQGECAIVGHIASMDATLTTANLNKAGTAVGFASRLGARDARLERFEMSDDSAAYRKAIVQAYANARIQAEALAAAAGQNLGPILSMGQSSTTRKKSADTIVESLHRIPGVGVNRFAKPVTVDVAPEPIETSAQISVTFALLR